MSEHEASAVAIPIQRGDIISVFDPFRQYWVAAHVIGMIEGSLILATCEWWGFFPTEPHPHVRRIHVMGAQVRAPVLELFAQAEREGRPISELEATLEQLHKAELTPQLE